jgi:hypothetical protein
MARDMSINLIALCMDYRACLKESGQNAYLFMLSKKEAIHNLSGA